MWTVVFTLLGATSLLLTLAAFALQDQVAEERSGAGGLACGSRAT